MLTVATYNLYLGADLSPLFGVQDTDDLLRQARTVQAQLVGTEFPSRAKAIAALVARERIDVLGLQEVAGWTRTTTGGPGEEVWCDYLAELLIAFEAQGTPYDAHAPNSNFHGGAAVSADESMGVVGYNVILVRRDCGVEVTAARTGDFHASLDIATGMADLVLNVPRSWGWVDATAAGRRFRFVNTHTEAFDAGTRNAQRDELLDAIGEPGVPVLVVGDFNAPPSSVGMPPAYVDAWLAVGGDPGAGFTCGQAADLANPESTLAERIDYVWVRDALVTGCRVVGDAPGDRTQVAGLWPSDHACVVAAVDLSRSAAVAGT